MSDAEQPKALQPGVDIYIYHSRYCNIYKDIFHLLQGAGDDEVEKLTPEEAEDWLSLGVIF